MDRDFLNIVIVGHVDHGKSTLIGRLLYDTHSIPDSLVEEAKQISKELGKEMEFAYLLDALEEEREENITIDTTQTFFSTENREYIIIDAPGHKEFLKNMITGASMAQAGVLIVDVERGLEEQTRRHAYLLSLIGIQDVVIAVNKMDAVSYSEEKFKALSREITEFFKKIDITPLEIVPVSAREGENVASPSKSMPWWKGDTIVQALDTFHPEKSTSTESLRFPIQDCYRIAGKEVYVGRIESGEISVGDSVKILPNGDTAEIHSIEVWEDEKDSAGVGECIGVTFKSNYSQILERGVMICAGEEPRLLDTIEATLFWLGEEPLPIGTQMTLRCATQDVNCTLKQIKERIDSSTLESSKSTALNMSEVGQVVIKTERPIVVEEMQEIEALGRFVLVQDNDIRAGGIVHL